VAVALGCLAVLASGMLRYDACFRGPDLIFRWFALPLLGLALCLAFALLPATGQLALASVLVTWGMLESGFGVAERRREAHTEAFVARDYYQPDPMLGYGPERGIRARAWKRVDGSTLYDVEYDIDENGRRITPFEHPERRDRFLLFFGCSFAFGEGVSAEQTLPAFVARAAPRYVPYNYAFHGYGPNQLVAKLESGTLRQEIREREGTLVYVLIGAHVSRAIGSMVIHTRWAHDAPYYALDTAGQPVRRGTFTTGRPVLALGYALLGRSNVLRFLQLDVPPVITQHHIALTAGLLARSAALFRQSFGPERFVVVVHPEHWPSEVSARLAKALSEEGVEVLDYAQLFGADRQGYFFPEDRHPTARAHKAVAARLVADVGLGERDYTERLP